MKHPTPSELVDLQRGELPIERAREIRDHLETCEECRAGWEALENLAGRLSAWEDEPVSATFVGATMQAIDRAEAAAATAGRNTTFAWFRRAAIAVAAVAASLLFQAFVWNPLDTPRSFRAIFDLIPEAAALTLGEAVPDTILVLTVHPDGKISTSLLPEEPGRLEDLIPRILEQTGDRDFRAILLLGADPEGSVTIDRRDLEPLLEELDIERITAGSGVVLVEGRSAVVARIGVPLRRVVTEVVRDTTDARGARIIQLRPRAEYIVDVRADSLQTGSFAIEMRYERGEERPHIRLVHPYLILRSGTDSAQALRDSLTAPEQIVLTMTEDGQIITNWAVMPLEEFRDMAGRLIELSGGVSLLVLIPEGEEAREMLLLQILREAGGERIEVKRIKK